eukprot:scaffold245704_cov40-Tisochrysis_lutea.AAC.1
MEQSLVKRLRPPSEAEQRAGACDSRRATWPVAPATPCTTDMLAPPHGEQQSANSSRTRTRTGARHCGGASPCVLRRAVSPMWATL